MERSTDRMFDYLEWPMEHSKFVRTVRSLIFLSMYKSRYV